METPHDGGNDNLGNGPTVMLSHIWDIFEKCKNSSGELIAKAKCIICQQVLKTTGGNTTSLHSHARKHKYAAPKRQITEKSSNQNEIPRELTTFEVLNLKYPVHAKLSRLIALDGFTFQVFQRSRDLRESLQAWLKINKMTERLPQSRTTVKEYVMFYGSEAKELIKNILRVKLNLGQRFSVDFDEWTSCSNHRYLNLSVFTPENVYWNLGLVKITGSANAENILSLVEIKLNEFGMEKKKDIVSFITDGAAVMKKLSRISGIGHQFCLVHGIQLAVTDVLYKKKSEKPQNVESTEKEVEDDTSVESGLHVDSVGGSSGTTVIMMSSEIYYSIEKLRKLASFFKRSAYNNEKLQEFVKSLLQVNNELPLKHDSPTRWSSLYVMIERYWEIRRALDHALMVIKTGITISDQDKYVYWCILKTLGPVTATVKALCREDASLLTSRAALIVLFRHLEFQASKNALSRKFLFHLKSRISERFSTNSSVLKYLSDGNYANDYSQYKKTHVNDEDDDEDEDSFCENQEFECLFENEGSDTSDGESESEDETTPREVTVASIFEIPQQSIIKTHLVNLISRLYPNLDVQTPHVQENPEPSQVKKRSFMEKINDAINNSESSISHVCPTQSQLARAVHQEMMTFQKTKQRGFYLEECFRALKTIKPSSVESERAFSVSGYLCTKIRNRFNSDTLSTLCFLGHLFRNQTAFAEANIGTEQ